MLKRAFKLFATLSLCVVSNVQAFAANEVLWDKQAVVIEISNDLPKYTQEYPMAINEIGDIIDTKFSSTQQPFKTRHVNNYANNGDIGTDDYIAVVPVVLDEGLYERKIALRGKFTGQTAYRYDVISQLNLLFCAKDGGDFRILYNKPLAAHKEFGQDMDLYEMLDRKYLGKVFTDNIKFAVDNQLKLPANFGELINRDTDSAQNTYQVTDVTVSSVGFRQGFSEKAIENYVKPLVATAFTNAYANKHPEYVVLPSVSSTINWKKAVLSHLEPESQKTDYEDIDISKTGRGHAITLDIYKLAVGDTKLKGNMKIKSDIPEKWLNLVIGIKYTDNSTGKTYVFDSITSHFTTEAYTLKDKVNWNFVLSKAAKDLVNESR